MGAEPLSKVVGLDTRRSASISAAARAIKGGPVDASTIDVLEALPMRAAVIGPDGVLLAANSLWLDVAPVRDQTALVYPGDNVFVAWRAVRGSAGERSARFADVIEAVLDDGEARWFDELHQIGAHDLRWFRSRVAPLGEAGGAVLVMHVDVTEEVRGDLNEARVAIEDGLTRLPNRVTLLERMELALDEAHGRGTGLALFIIDLDSFKTINDSLGREAGDSLIKAAAQRIGAALPGDAWLARFTGDAFAVLLEAKKPENRVLAVAQRIRDAIAEPAQVDEREVVLTASVGIAVASRSHRLAEDLIREAEAASLRASARGRGEIEVADGEARTRAMARLETEQALRSAIANSELRLAYQAEVSLESGGVIGAEALLRWHRPDGVEVRPDDFVALAEETGLIVPIGDWVIYEACRAAANWPEVDGVGLFVAVNLSARQLLSPALVDMVRVALNGSGLAPGRLCVELTESTLVGHLDEAVAVLRRLRAMGVLIALDDFGTGYSSLSYLRALPVDIVKLDRSFVEQIDTDPVARAIVGAVLSLAQSLGLRVVAEGVESEAQRAELVQLGCDVVQGFSFSHPIDEAGFIHLALARHQP